MAMIDGVARALRVRHAAGGEIVLEQAKALLRRRVEQADPRHDDRGMEFFAVGDEGLHHRDADGAAEIAHHVEQ